MIWGLALISLVAFLLAFASHSAGWMGLGIFVGFVAGIAAALVFIDRHLRASSRPEYLTEGELRAMRTSVQRTAQSQTRLPPPPPR